ncbi:uncharacterized protein LOC118433541 isoform X2 [Folsomia candida]|uniref:uncharacterized protein LOC118433541 isoform X2 n=1 Tax=Folsomia candida TaxID=158441 RepID=UPI00160550BA|nr:uncharacterized protein LOC118433541 isoform X2 [Folsomia candida]
MWTFQLFFCIFTVLVTTECSGYKVSGDEPVIQVVGRIHGRKRADERWDDYEGPDAKNETSSVNENLGEDVTQYSMRDTTPPAEFDYSTSPDYGWGSYYGDNVPLIMMDDHPENNAGGNYGYLPGPPPSHFYPKRRPSRRKNLLQLLQTKAGRKFKALSSLLAGLGVTAAPPQMPTTAEPTQPTSSVPPPATPPTTSPAVDLLAQLAPTLTKLVDSVGNAVGGEGSLLALKRDALVARLKYKKALFIGLPESLLLAKLKIPGAIVQDFGQHPMEMSQPPPVPASTTTMQTSGSESTSKATPTTTPLGGSFSKGRLADMISITYDSLKDDSRNGYSVPHHLDSPSSSSMRAARHPIPQHSYYRSQFMKMSSSNGLSRHSKPGHPRFIRY